MTQQSRQFRQILTFTAILALAGCTAIPDVADTPSPPTPSVAPPPPPPPHVKPTTPWDLRPIETGAWRYDAASRSATFAQGSTTVARFICTGGNIQFSAENMGAAAQPLTGDLKTNSGIHRLRFEPYGPNGASLTLPARDNKWDQIAFSRGRFALEAGNGRVLTLPVHSEIGRVIEDCRG